MIEVEPQEFYRVLHKVEGIRNAGATTKYQPAEDVTRWYIAGEDVGMSVGKLGTRKGYSVTEAAAGVAAPVEGGARISTRGITDPVQRYLEIVRWLKARYTDPTTGMYVTASGGPTYRGGRPSRYTLGEDAAASKLLGARRRFGSGIQAYEVCIPPEEA